MYGMGSLSGNYLREYPRATQMVGHLRSGIANRTERYRPMVRHVR